MSTTTKQDTERASDPTLQWWAGSKEAAARSGFSSRHIEELARKGLIRSSLIKRPGAKRGRRLYDMNSLFAYIEAGVNQPKAKLAMDSRA